MRLGPQGVPIRLEIGPADLAKNETRAVRRYGGEKKQISLDGLAATIKKELEEIQAKMFADAKKTVDERLVRLETFDNFVKTLDAKNRILAPWCERIECEDSVKDRSARMWVLFVGRFLLAFLILALRFGQCLRRTCRRKGPFDGCQDSLHTLCSADGEPDCSGQDQVLCLRARCQAICHVGKELLDAGGARFFVVICREGREKRRV